jgi:cytochrome c peroxidase
VNLKKIYIFNSLFGCILLLTNCNKEEVEDQPKPQNIYEATPYTVVLPFYIAQMPIPENNPLTVEGINLGRHLFWDKNLSRNSTISCGSCHLQFANFSDTSQYSMGVDGIPSKRHSMPLINLAWSSTLFWDGRAASIEEQIFEPVPNHIEMDLPWQQAVERLNGKPEYRTMFYEAYGSESIDSVKVSLAIAQFLRTMVSFNSKYDKWYTGQAQLTASELSGLELFQKEGGDPEIFPGGQFGGDCFHCHGGSLDFFTDYQFHNNGLDSIFEDEGLAIVTGSALDIGRFKTPTLRNIELSAPYMHDGRFKTLEEVIEHYNSGGHPSPTIDPFMKNVYGGLGLTTQSKIDLINFIKTLTDQDFVNNPLFQDPN